MLFWSENIICIAMDESLALVDAKPLIYTLFVLMIFMEVGYAVAIQQQKHKI